MLSANNYKRILSQLFDVKPMKNSADLDWEMIKKADKVLNLKNVVTKKEIHIRREALILNRERNVRSLRENESVIFIRQNRNDCGKKIVKVSSLIDDAVDRKNFLFGEEASVYSQLLSDDYFAAVKNKGEQFSFTRLNEELPLTQKDALRELEKVDARDNVIEEQYNEVEGLFAEQIGLSSVDPINQTRRSPSRKYCGTGSGAILSAVETPEHSFKFIFLAPSLFSKIRFNGLTILIFAAISFFSAA